MTRMILVDDTDPGITYTGSWFEDHGSLDILGSFGPTYQHTLHGTTSDASFSYTFQGTSIVIVGTQQYQDTTTATNPSWKCIVDGKSIKVQNLQIADNGLTLCFLSNMHDGIHMIVVDVYVEDNKTFWFDYLRYQPSASVSVDNAAISVSAPDPEIRFGTGWRPFSFGYQTTVTGSVFTFDFYGISLTWYGSYSSLDPTAATTATYIVDGGSSISFDLNGIGATELYLQFNQLFFTTPIYPPGAHTLQVIYQGNDSTTPLALDFLLIQNGTSTTNSTSSNPNHRESDVVPIAIGVVLGLALVTGAIFLLLFLRRKKRLQSQEAENLEGDMASNNHGFITPYPLDAASGSHPPSASENSPSLSGNPVVGKRNAAAIEVGEAGRSPNPRDSANTFNNAGPDSMYASRPTSNLRPVGNLVPTDRLNHSFATTSDSPSNSEIAANSGSLSQLGSNSNPGLSSADATRIVRDEDSGIRIQQTDEGEVVVLPPLYTAP